MVATIVERERTGVRHSLEKALSNAMSTAARDGQRRKECRRTLKVRVEQRIVMKECIQ